VTLSITAGGAAQRITKGAILRGQTLRVHVPHTSCMLAAVSLTLNVL
jgi:hypothetical protein